MKKIKVKCKKCGFLTEIDIQELKKYGFYCPKCGHREGKIYL